MRAALAVLLLASAATAQAQASATGPTGPAAAPKPAAAPAARPAVAPAPRPGPTLPASSPRKVWTNADLAKLHDSAQINYVDTPSIGVAAPPVPTAVVDNPDGVPERLQELVNEAQANLARLESEKLAGANPLLRGLNGSKPPRPVADVDADIARWSDRLKAAQNALDQARP